MKYTEIVNRQGETKVFRRKSDGVFIPNDPLNIDFQRMQKEIKEEGADKVIDKEKDTSK